MRKINTEHIETYKSGCFKKLFDVIKEDPDLSFEIRLDNQVMVYYRKCKILTIDYSKQSVDILDSKYYNDSNKPSVSFDDASLDYTLNHKSLLEKYFKEAKKLVYAYKIGMEFEIQQNIALGNRDFNKRYLVVDMEWQFSQLDIPSDKRITRTRIDLVVVDTKPNSNGENDIYLAEIKVGTGAAEGKSGIVDHVRKTKELIDMKEACKALKDDVDNILKQKIELGLIGGTPVKLNLSLRPKMMLILAYRREDEKKRLEEHARIAAEAASEIGLEHPHIIFHNALIELK